MVTTTVEPTGRWVLVVDERSGRLLRVERAPAGGVRVTSEEEIKDERAEPRPGGAREHAGPGDRPGERNRARFAKEIAVWLERLAEDLHIDHVDVFAPARLLGGLREAWSSRLAIRVDEHRGDLAHLNDADLARHESITALVVERRG